MSGIEIERKFLVHKNSRWKRLVYATSTIKQGYISANGATVRVRLRDEKAFLTIKSPSKNGLSRYEFEKEIEINEAEELLKLCSENHVLKQRHLVKVGQHVWEIDEFHGNNEGLVIAEVELKSENEKFERPDFIGKEVTYDPRFHNAYLVTHPFSEWKESLPENYR